MPHLLPVGFAAVTLYIAVIRENADVGGDAAPRPSLGAAGGHIEDKNDSEERPQGNTLIRRRLLRQCHYSVPVNLRLLPRGGYEVVDVHIQCKPSEDLGATEVEVFVGNIMEKTGHVIGP